MAQNDQVIEVHIIYFTTKATNITFILGEKYVFLVAENDQVIKVKLHIREISENHCRDIGRKLIFSAK